ncbi:MAG: ABC transporter permease [Blautia marasmi]
MILQSLKMAWNAVCSNKMRTFLTMLGIIIGVIALVVLVSIADGATSSVTDQISNMGSNYLTVSISDDKENPLRLSELSGFTENENIEAAAPVSRTSVTAKSGYVDGSMTLIGTTGSYLDIQNLELAYGRNIKNTDVENNSYVVILTKDSAEELFGYEDAVGETVALDGRSFLVVGILDEEESASAVQMSAGSEEREAV